MSKLGTKICLVSNLGTKNCWVSKLGTYFFRVFLASSCEGSLVTKFQFRHHEPLEYGRIEDALQNCLRRLTFYLPEKLVKNAILSGGLNFPIFFAKVSKLGTIIMLPVNIGDMYPNYDRRST